MSLRRLLTESAQFVAVGVISIFLAVIGINAVGFLIAGRNQGTKAFREAAPSTSLSAYFWARLLE